MDNPVSHRSALLVLLLALGVTSCSNGHKPVYPVHGQVVDSGDKPAVGALIVFHPMGVRKDDVVTPRPVAQVDETGAFRLTSYTKGDGAPAGEYAVTIMWPAPRKNPLEPQGPDQLKGAYNDPSAPKIRFRVEEQPDNQVPLIKLP
jgi:hypothetical protein